MICVKLAGPTIFHAQNLTCSNCHDVHATEAKVLGLDKKQTIKLCVDCHSDFNQKKEGE